MSREQFERRRSQTILKLKSWASSAHPSTPPRFKARGRTKVESPNRLRGPLLQFRDEVAPVIYFSKPSTLTPEQTCLDFHDEVLVALARELLEKPRRPRPRRCDLRLFCVRVYGSGFKVQGVGSRVPGLVFGVGTGGAALPSSCPHRSPPVLS